MPQEEPRPLRVVLLGGSVLLWAPCLHVGSSLLEALRSLVCFRGHHQACSGQAALSVSCPWRDAISGFTEGHIHPTPVMGRGGSLKMKDYFLNPLKRILWPSCF